MSRSVRMRPIGGTGFWERSSFRAEREGLATALLQRYLIKSLITGLSYRLLIDWPAFSLLFKLTLCSWRFRTVKKAYGSVSFPSTFTVDPRVG